MSETGTFEGRSSAILWTMARDTATRWSIRGVRRRSTWRSSALRIRLECTVPITYGRWWPASPSAIAARVPTSSARYMWLWTISASASARNVARAPTAIALGEAGHRRPYVIGTVHSSRIRSVEDRHVLRSLTPRMDHLVAVSRAIVHKIADERPSNVPVSLVHNGVDLQRYDHQEACCTLREEYAMTPGAQIVGVVARLEPEKGHPTLIDAWPLVLRVVPDAYLLVVGEGSRREALGAQAAERGVADRVIFTC